jgi:hypothetical protein
MKFYIPFNDCVYSFKDAKTYSYKELSHIPFLYKVERNFPIYNQEKTDILFERIFNPTFPFEERQYMGALFARSLAGCVEDKFWVFGSGERNSGKGVITKLLADGFKCLIGNFAANSLLPSANKDPEKALSFALSNQFCRILIANEVGIPKDDGKDEEITCLDGVAVKTIASGGDTITTRLQHKNSLSFTVNFIMFIFANVVPTTKPVDACENRIVFNFNTKFVDENDDKLGKSDFYKKSDPEIKKVTSDEGIIEAFVLWVLGCFHQKKSDIVVPASIKDAIQDEKGDDTISPSDFIINNFVKADSCSYYSVAELEAILKANNIFNYGKIATLFKKFPELGFFKDQVKADPSWDDDRINAWNRGGANSGRRRALIGCKYIGVAINELTDDN